MQTLNGNVVLEPLSSDEIVSGIILPTETNLISRGKVVNFDNDVTFLSVGDEVLYFNTSEVSLVVEGKQCVLVHSDELAAIV